MTRASSVHIEDRGSSMANPLGHATHNERLREAAVSESRPDLSLIAVARASRASITSRLPTLVLRAAVPAVMTQAHSTYVAYTGSSMKPIFKPGDLLQVLPYANRQSQAWGRDLLVLPLRKLQSRTPRGRLDARGIRTKGDNNARIDPWVVTPRQVVGYVVHAQRGRRWRRISGGYIGTPCSERHSSSKAY